MDWITGVQQAIDYVEDHMMEPVDYEAAAVSGRKGIVRLKCKNYRYCLKVRIRYAGEFQQGLYPVPWSVTFTGQK